MYTLSFKMNPRKSDSLY